MIAATAALVLAVTGHVVFHIQDPALSESSALVDLGAEMATVNDSGHDPVVYVLDSRTGATRRTVRYADTAVDTEAMAPAGPHAVWVGDIGDNLRQRDTVVVHRVRLDGDGSAAASYRLAYPDGAHDAEALFVGPHGRLYVVTKQVFGAGVYAAPRRLTAGVNRLRRVADAPPLVTDAAALPGGRHVLVRDYGFVHVYAVGSWRSLGSFRLPVQRQGESISVGPGGRIRIGSEGRHAAVVAVRLPDRIAEKTAKVEASGGDERGHERADGTGPASPEESHPWLPGLAWLFWVAGGTAGLVGVIGVIGVALLRRGRRRSLSR